MNNKLRKFRFNLKFFFNFLFTLATICLLLISLAGYLGRFNIYLDTVSHFKVQYLILSFCPFIFFAIQFGLNSRQKLGLILSGICLAINLWEIVPWYFPHHLFAKHIEGQQLRVLLTNVDKHKDNYDRAIALVEKELPDVAVFVEVGKSGAAKLKAALKDILPYGIAHQDTNYDGTLILSNIVLENRAAKSLGGGRKSLLADLTVSGQVISLIAAHPSNAIGEIYVKERNRQLAAIGDYAAKVKNPVIVVGDMNVTMWSPYYRDLADKAKLSNVRAGFGVVPTWPTFNRLLNIPIDHCLVSKEFQVLNVRRGSHIGSDHFPLIVDLAIGSQP